MDDTYEIIPIIALILIIPSIIIGIILYNSWYNDHFYRVDSRVETTVDKTERHRHTHYHKSGSIHYTTHSYSYHVYYTYDDVEYCDSISKNEYNKLSEGDSIFCIRTEEHRKEDDTIRRIWVKYECKNEG